MISALDIQRLLDYKYFTFWTALLRQIIMWHTGIVTGYPDGTDICSKMSLKISVILSIKMLFINKKLLFSILI